MDVLLQAILSAAILGTDASTKGKTLFFVDCFFTQLSSFELSIE